MANPQPISSIDTKDLFIKVPVICTEYEARQVYNGRSFMLNKFEAVPDVE